MADDRDEDLLRSLYLQGKVVLVGDSGVGKTAIFNSFSDGVGFGEFRKTWTTPNGDNLVVRDTRRYCMFQIFPNVHAYAR